MIGFVVALFEEIKPIFEIEKNYSKIKIGNFNLFDFKKFIIIQSGIGKINSAIATTILLTKFDIKKVFNIGICGAKSIPIGKILRIGQIVDCDSNKKYVLNSGEKLYTISKTSKEYPIVDMEASGFLVAAKRFNVEVDIIKIVSDNLNNFDKAKVPFLMKKLWQEVLKKL